MDSQQDAFTGRVELDQVAGGSKSERAAVTLHSDDGKHYVLRRQGGPAFGDETLDALVGSALTVNGVAIGNTLYMKDWQRRD